MRLASNTSPGGAETGGQPRNPAGASVARRRPGPEVARARDRVHRDRPHRHREVRARQGERAPAHRPAAALLQPVPHAVRLRAADLLRRRGRSPLRRANRTDRHRRRRRPARHLRAQRAGDPEEWIPARATRSAACGWSTATRPTTRSSPCSRATRSMARRRPSKPSAGAPRPPAPLLPHLQADAGRGRAEAGRDRGDLRARRGARGDPAQPARLSGEVRA